MIRSVWNALAVVLVLHLLAAAGLSAWLWGSGRLSRQRLHALVETFKPTLAQEQAQLEQARQLEEQTREQARELARLQSVGDRPSSVDARLLETRQLNDLEALKLDRLKRERDDLQRQIEVARQEVLRQKQELEARQKAFELARNREERLRNDRDFRQAVEMYEQLRPRQVKGMFQDLIKQRKTEEVVEYLAAMQLRKAAAVLGEFKTGEEVPLATDLVQRLRQRGVDLLRGGSPPTSSSGAS